MTDIKVDEEWPHIDMNASHDFFSSDLFSDEVLSLSVGNVDTIFSQPTDENNDDGSGRKRRKLSVGQEADDALLGALAGGDDALDSTFEAGGSLMADFASHLMPPSPTLSSTVDKISNSSTKSTDGQTGTTNPSLKAPPVKKTTATAPTAPTATANPKANHDAVRKAAQEAVAQLAGSARTKTIVAPVATKKGVKKSGAVAGVEAGKVVLPSLNTPNPLLTIPQFNGIGKKNPSSVAVVEMSPVSSCGETVDTGLLSSSAVATAAAAAASMYKSSSIVSDDGQDYQNLLTSAASKQSNAHAKVNISSDHVHALTSSNWVAACSASGVANFNPNSTNLSAQAQANKRRRQNLTADERAKQNRDRNREHARNTRLRKKAYVEELKRTLTEMVKQRDAAELERKRTTQRELETREVRFRVLEEFFKLRAAAESNTAKWNAILESNFNLTLPVTSYRESVSKKKGLVRHVSGDLDNIKKACNAYTEQVLNGIDEIVQDATLEAAFYNSVGKPLVDADDCGIVSYKFDCDKSLFFMDGCNAMAKWIIQTTGVVKRGGSSELKVVGDVRARYCPTSNKLVSLDMTFDTASVQAQLNAFLPQEESYHPSLLSAADTDALLDSIPQMSELKHCVSSSDKSSSEASSDEQDMEPSSKKAVVAIRRSTRRH